MATKQFRQQFIFFFNIKVTTNRYYSAHSLDNGRIWTGYELDFTIDILMSVGAGFFIGAEREARGKAGGISTN